MAMSEKVRIVHMLCSSRYSGAENVVCQIIGMFRGDARYEFIYASPDGPVREALEERGVAFAPMRAASVGEFRRIIRELKPDIVHAHDMRAGFLAALACGNIPLICHVHNNNFDSRKLSVKSLLFRHAARKARHLFWVSQSSFSGYCFHAGLEPKSTVLYNVIDREALREKADRAERNDAYDIVYLGRLTYQKDPQRLVKVLAGILQADPGARCAIIGEGELQEETAALIRENRLEDRVEMLGFRSNPYGILRSAGMMLMTSRWEGTPMCALEAMSFGIPIVSTPTDGMKELVEDGVTGFLSEDDAGLVRGALEILAEGSPWRQAGDTIRARAGKLMDMRGYRETLERQYGAGG